MSKRAAAFLQRMMLACCCLFAVSQPNAQTLSLNEQFVAGWNLAGNSADSALDVAGVFGGADTAGNVVSVWSWNAAQSKWAFYSPKLSATALTDYANQKGYDLLQVITPGAGYWINASGPFSLPARSVSPVKLLGLQPGWNLTSVGRDLAATDAAALIKSASGADPLTLWAWDSTGGKWFFYAPSLAAGALQSYITQKGYLDFTAQGRSLNAGTGFWVNATGAATASVVQSTPPSAVTGTVLFASPMSRVGFVDIDTDGTRSVIFQNPPVAGQPDIAPTRIASIVVDEPGGAHYEAQFDGQGVPSSIRFDDFRFDVGAVDMTTGTVDLRLSRNGATVQDFVGLDVGSKLSAQDITVMTAWRSNAISANWTDPFANVKPCAPGVDRNSDLDTWWDCIERDTRHMVWEISAKGHVTADLVLSAAESLTDPATYTTLIARANAAGARLQRITDRVLQVGNKVSTLTGTAAQKLAGLLGTDTKLITDPVASSDTGASDAAEIGADAQAILATPWPTGMKRLDAASVAIPTTTTSTTTTTTTTTTVGSTTTTTLGPACRTDAECSSYTTGDPMEDQLWTTLRCPQPFTKLARVDLPGYLLEFKRGLSGGAASDGSSAAVKYLQDYLVKANSQAPTVHCYDNTDIYAASPPARRISIVFNDVSKGWVNWVGRNTGPYYNKPYGENTLYYVSQTTPPTLAVRRHFDDNGKRTGEYREFCDGVISLREGTYTDDKPSGTWFSYTCPGHLPSGETRYDDQGVAIYGKETAYWPNSTTVSAIYVSSLANGSYDFSATHYDKSGALCTQPATQWKAGQATCNQ